MCKFWGWKSEGIDLVQGVESCRILFLGEETYSLNLMANCA